MITKDQSIIMQVAAKIASELTNTTNLPDRNADTVQATFLSHFDVVNEALQKANGMSLLQEAFPKRSWRPSLPRTPTHVPPFRLQPRSSRPSRRSRSLASSMAIFRTGSSLPVRRLAWDGCGTTVIRLSARSVRGSSRLTLWTVRNRSLSGLPEGRRDQG